MNKLTLESICGKHIFSGCELTTENVYVGYGSEACTVCLFTLDGVTYKAVENPDDGYRSYCKDIEISEIKPKYSFNGIEVVCSMMESIDSFEHDVLIIQDAKNGKTVLEVGTKYVDDYYPCCHFDYTPENMSCN